MYNTTTKRTQKPYKHLTREDRVKIEVLLSQGKNNSYIANYVGVHRSTISRELRKRIKTKVYLKTSKVKNLPYTAQRAHKDYLYKRSFSKCSYIIEKYPKLKKFIEDKILIDKWMPDVISNYILKHELYLEDGMAYISTPSIYLAIRNNILNINIKNMRRMKEDIKLKRTFKHPVQISKKDVSIELRPEYINDRSSFGHFEADTVISKRSGKRECLLTLTERKTRYEFIIKLKQKTKEEVNVALINLINQHPGIIKSITTDNGSEFNDFRYIAEITGVNFYFCHPYASCEKGSNEKHNSLIRYFIKKGALFENYTQNEINKIATWMNNYPRKILKWNTPNEMFHHELLLI